MITQFKIDPCPIVAKQWEYWLKDIGEKYLSNQKNACL
jgi:hypothetical protein